VECKLSCCQFFGFSWLLWNLVALKLSEGEVGWFVVVEDADIAMSNEPTPDRREELGVKMQIRSIGSIGIIGFAIIELFDKAPEVRTGSTSGTTKGNLSEQVLNQGVKAFRHGPLPPVPLQQPSRKNLGAEPS
jgi:hypothetical protein